MPNESVNNIAASEGSDFLKSGWQDPNILGDFFQETSDGNISIGPKAQKSGIEIATTILSYLVPVMVVSVLILSGHVFIRGQESTGFIENYQFICPYLNYGVSTTDDVWCKTLTMIAADYEEKQKVLQDDIINILVDYIPIKTSKSIIDASPEKKFVLDTFAKKIRVDDIMNDFQTVIKKSVSPKLAQVDRNLSNIECSGLSITNRDNIVTQCTVYGGAIGEDDSKWNFGSSRIETLRFIEKLSDTSNSKFILLNYPTALSVEKVEPTTSPNPIFLTKTTIPIQARYTPLSIKP